MPPSMSLRLERLACERRAERIADDHGLPAQMRNRQIERLDQIEAGEIGRKQHVGPHRALEIRLGDVAGRRRSPLRESDRRSSDCGEPPKNCARSLTLVGIHSAGGSLKVRASVLTNVAARAPGEKSIFMVAHAVLRIGRPPREVADHRRDPARGLGRRLERDAARRSPSFVRFCAASAIQSSPGPVDERVALIEHDAAVARRLARLDHERDRLVDRERVEPRDEKDVVVAVRERLGLADRAVPRGNTGWRSSPA